MRGVSVNFSKCSEAVRMPVHVKESAQELCMQELSLMPWHLIGTTLSASVRCHHDRVLHPCKQKKHS